MPSSSSSAGQRVGGEREVVAGHRRPVGLAEAGLVDQQGAEPLGEHRQVAAEVAPRRRARPAAVQQHHRRGRPGRPGRPRGSAAASPPPRRTGWWRRGAAVIGCPLRPSRRADREAELAAAEHRQRPLRVVDRVHPAGVRVAPEPLDRRARFERPAAGVLEQPVHRADRLRRCRAPGRGAPAAAAASGSSRPRRRAGHQLGHVALERQPGRVELGRRLGDPDLRERVLGRLLPDVGRRAPARAGRPRARRRRPAPCR